jgi:hypothetical protein
MRLKLRDYPMMLLPLVALIALLIVGVLITIFTK